MFQPFIFLFILSFCYVFWSCLYPLGVVSTIAPYRTTISIDDIYINKERVHNITCGDAKMLINKSDFVLAYWKLSTLRCKVLFLVLGQKN